MSQRSLVIYFTAFGVGLILCIVFALRPTPVLGVDGDSLSGSLNGSAALDAVTEPCIQAGDDWNCNLSNGSGGQTPYAVTVDWWGCWEASRAGKSSADGGAPGSMDGCISILDH